MVGCDDQLFIRFEPPLREPGQYSVAIEANGRPESCEATVGAPGGQGGAAGAGGVTVIEQPEWSCSSDSIGLAVARAESGYQLMALYLHTTPSTISVEVSRAGEVLATGSFTPEYETFTPNGPECEPTCTQATVELPTNR